MIEFDAPKSGDKLCNSDGCKCLKEVTEGGVSTLVYGDCNDKYILGGIIIIFILLGILFIKYKKTWKN